MTVKGSDNTASRQVMAAMRNLRRQRGISLAALADRLGDQGVICNRAMLTNQETGRRQEMSVDQVVALAKVFGVAIDDLLANICETCRNEPPAGYTCNTCGRTG